MFFRIQSNCQSQICQSSFHVSTSSNLWAGHSILLEAFQPLNGTHRESHPMEMCYPEKLSEWCFSWHSNKRMHILSLLRRAHFVAARLWIVLRFFLALVESITRKCHVLPPRKRFRLFSFFLSVSFFVVFSLFFFSCFLSCVFFFLVIYFLVGDSHISGLGGFRYVFWTETAFHCFPVFFFFFPPIWERSRNRFTRTTKTHPVWKR